jgi:paraquat-inducible protein A
MDNTGENPMSANFVSGNQMGLVQCNICHQICRLPQQTEQIKHLRCPGCNEKIEKRKTFSLSKTWALLIASVIFYIPANIMPMTVVTSLWGTKSDTIVSGVIYFVKTGMWPIALIIFTASVLVPLLKIAILLGLLISVRTKSQYSPVTRTRLYRLTEIVGRWSMVDVYVVTILAGLVKMEAVATFRAGPAAIYFCMVVIFTMFAAISFDPRLIWDGLKYIEPEHKNE